MICMSCKRDQPIERFAKPRKTGRRSRRCSSCKKTATCAVKRWHAKGRDCSRCGQIRPCPAEITDFPWRPAVCAACQKANERRRQAEWAAAKRASDPDFRRRQIDATLRWQKSHPEYVLNAERTRYAKIKADPERWARYKEDARMRYRLRQMRNGRTVRVLSEKTYMRKYGTGFGNGPSVPVTEELLQLVRRTVERDGRHGDKRIYGILNGQKRVSLVTADRLCAQYGMPLNLIYPELAA